MQAHVIVRIARYALNCEVDIICLLKRILYYKRHFVNFFRRLSRVIIKKCLRILLKIGAKN